MHVYIFICRIMYMFTYVYIWMHVYSGWMQLVVSSTK